MATQQSGEFNVEEKLRLLRQSRTHLCRILHPEAIFPELSMIIDVELGRRILDMADAGKREEAMGLVIDRVLDRGEAGLNYFLVALREEGDNAGWPQALALLGHSSSIDDANRLPSNYYAFIIHLLKGKIIEKLTDGILSALIIHLSSNDVIEEYEKDLVEAKLKTKGCRYAALQLFSLLGMHREDWPVFFFEALQQEVPSLLQKMSLFGIDPVISKEESEFNVGRGTSSGRVSPEGARFEDQEQTLPKQLATLQNEQAPGGCQADGGTNLSDEERESELSSSDRVPSTETADSDDVDDGRSGFSDDEKQDVEVSEKTTEGREGVPRARNQDLELRRYQFELAEKAVQGNNTIICAPTGSGKTRVALHIVKQHLTAAPQGQARKVVFLARTVPLVSQQYRNFRDYLPEYNCELVTGESGNSMTVHQILDKNDILVLTPKILENHLRPDKIPSLSVFSLIIFDECHHTRKGEPYNSVMKHYIKSKDQHEPGLPQIVGLTASIGVEKATTPDEAKESILGIMANLDVTVISEVQENTDELLDMVPRPVEDLMTLVPREFDEISNAISNVMLKIEEELLKREEVVKGDPEVSDLHTLLKKRETDLRSQKFAQWATNLKNQAKLLKYPKTPKDEQEMAQIMKRQVFAGEVQALAEWLVAYNEAFDVHDLTRPEDVLHYLQRKSLLLREVGAGFISTELDAQLGCYFKDVEKQLIKFKQHPNPNLGRLGDTILKHVKEAREDGFRILVFVRTRATCRALCRWLNDAETDPLLRRLNAQHFTGTGAHQEHGGMTQYEQVETLQRFKTGDVKILFTTSVGEEGIDIAECNLTIRYNHVGNEVTTVQTRGRSRKRGGRSILMAIPKIIEQEQLNRKREELMHAALNIIRRMSREQILEFVRKAQIKTLEVEEIDQITRQVKQLKTKEAEFSVTCPKCMKVKVRGDQIRRINNAHHVIVGHEIDEQVIRKPGNTFLKKDDWEMQGSVICRCKEKLGQLLLYKKARFIIVSPKYWVFLDKKNEPSTYKQWTKVPYHIDEFTSNDLRVHLGIAGSSGDDSTED
ncbi:ATP-dependent RNA helicase DHX58-like [Littorina saxatilis]|uniref:RNA helicase n=1 Tax=Littorina saxatilis TaxID=31220 RepID=A0AAN9BVB4_9CAEN